VCRWKVWALAKILLRIRATFGAFFAEHYYLFQGTPTRLWLDYAFQELFGLGTRLGRAKR